MCSLNYFTTDFNISTENTCSFCFYSDKQYSQLIGYSFSFRVSQTVVLFVVVFACLLLFLLVCIWYMNLSVGLNCCFTDSFGSDETPTWKELVSITCTVKFKCMCGWAFLLISFAPTINGLLVKKMGKSKLIFLNNSNFIKLH